MDGGYDAGYKACRCFWGRTPGSLLSVLKQHYSNFTGLKVLDAGCGEGKNAAHLASLGATVHAFDISECAIQNAKNAWPSTEGVTWKVADVREITVEKANYDIVIAYGLLHCFENELQVRESVGWLQGATAPGGVNIVVAMNSRYQELLEAHPGFHPCLLSHAVYSELYSGWEFLHLSDTDLTEVHAHNDILHTHSMTRILARKEELSLGAAQPLKTVTGRGHSRNANGEVRPE